MNEERLIKSQIDPYMLLVEAVSIFRDGFRGEEHRKEFHMKIATCLEQKDSALLAAFTEKRVLEGLRDEFHQIDKKIRDGGLMRGKVWGETFGSMAVEIIDQRLAKLRGEKDGKN